MGKGKRVRRETRLCKKKGTVVDKRQMERFVGPSGLVDMMCKILTRTHTCLNPRSEGSRRPLYDSVTLDLAQFDFLHFSILWLV
jgi:hypothetical protein